mmetsp:Transcript_34241/g.108816  ORF Transcript_34241/g.108816 Transcript_34241/m.108816 type:complete len:219 (+) Transcript_34241:755-1411(+)
MVASSAMACSVRRLLAVDLSRRSRLAPFILGAIGGSAPSPARAAYRSVGAASRPWRRMAAARAMPTSRSCRRAALRNAQGRSCLARPATGVSGAAAPKIPRSSASARFSARAAVEGSPARLTWRRWRHAPRRWIAWSPSGRSGTVATRRAVVASMPGTGRWSRTRTPAGSHAHLTSWKSRAAIARPATGSIARWVPGRIGALAVQLAAWVSRTGGASC